MQQSYADRGKFFAIAACFVRACASACFARDAPCVSAVLIRSSFPPLPHIRPAFSATTFHMILPSLVGEKIADHALHPSRGTQLAAFPARHDACGNLEAAADIRSRKPRRTALRHYTVHHTISSMRSNPSQFFACLSYYNFISSIIVRKILISDFNYIIYIRHKYR